VPGGRHRVGGTSGGSGRKKRARVMKEKSGVKKEALQFRGFFAGQACVFYNSFLMCLR
jgi:hypothetical protein